MVTKSPKSEPLLTFSNSLPYTDLDPSRQIRKVIYIINEFLRILHHLRLSTVRYVGSLNTVLGSGLIESRFSL